MKMENFLIPISILIFLNLTNGQKNDNVNKFTLNLLEKSMAENGNENLALSPFTVWSLLAVISEGALSTTAEELHNVLGIHAGFAPEFLNLSSENLLANSDGAQLETSNAMFVNEQITIRKRYKEIIKDFYSVDVQEVDFAQPQKASQTINNYVQKKTHNQLNNFIRASEVQNAQIFLTSILYFKGKWKFPFDKKETTHDDFFNEKNEKIAQVDFMHAIKRVGYKDFDNLQATGLELPYGNDGKMAMIIMLPFLNKTVTNVVNAMKTTTIKDILQEFEKSLKEYEEEIIITLPKFKISTKLKLKEILMDMNIKKIFDPLKANLIPMTNERLHVSYVVQKAEIEVNEEGTEASAAAGNDMFLMWTPAKKFKANRPFLYFIVNKIASTIVFGGKVMNPGQ